VAELLVAKLELAYQNEEKGKRAAELIIAKKELAFQNKERWKRAAELIIADKELAFQTEEKEERAAEFYNPSFKILNILPLRVLFQSRPNLPTLVLRS
jgi:hypothetical protein